MLAENDFVGEKMNKIVLQFIKNAFYVLSGSGLSLVVNYFFHLYVSRALGPARYGIYNSIMSSTLLFTFPFAAINLVVAKEVVSLEKDRVKMFLQEALGLTLILGGILFVVLVCSLKFILYFLHIKNILFGFIMIFIPISAIFPIALAGILQGLQLFRSFALVTFSSQFFRLIFGVYLVSIGFGIAGALSGSVLGGICALLLAIYLLKEYFKWPFFKFKKQKIKELFKKIFFYSTYTSAFSFLIYIDVPLVKHLFSAYDTGLYSAAALLGKVPIWLVGSIGSVVFPKVVEMKKQNQPYFRFYITAVGVCFIGLILCALGYYLLAPYVIKILFGKAYLNATPLLQLFGLAAIPLSLASIAVRYALALEDKKFLYLQWICICGFVISLYIMHPTLNYTILWLGLWSTVIFVGSFV